jgi:hypothetical protein
LNVHQIFNSQIDLYIKIHLLQTIVCIYIKNTIIKIDFCITTLRLKAASVYLHQTSNCQNRFMYKHCPSAKPYVCTFIRH